MGSPQYSVDYSPFGEDDEYDEENESDDNVISNPAVLVHRREENELDEAILRPRRFLKRQRQCTPSPSPSSSVEEQIPDRVQVQAVARRRQRRNAESPRSLENLGHILDSEQSLSPPPLPNQFNHDIALSLSGINKFHQCTGHYGYRDILNLGILHLHLYNNYTFSSNFIR